MALLRKLEQETSKRLSIVDGFAGLSSLSSFSHSFYNNITYKKVFAFYRKHPIVYAATHKIANAVLKNGYTFVETVPGKGKKNNKIVLENWFKHINPYDSFTQVMFNAIINTLTGGHHLIEIDKSNWNLYSDIDMSTMHQRLLDKNGTYKERKDAYWVQKDSSSTGRFTKIPVDNLIWLKLPAANSNDSLCPISPIIPLALDLETDIWGREHNLGSIKNGSIINLIIQVGKDATEAEAKEMLEFIKEQYVSTETENKSNKPFCTYGDIQVTEKTNSKDIDYINLRNSTLEAVSMVYNIPMRLFGVEKSGIGQGKAKSEALVEFYECTIYPLQNIWEDAINQQLIYQFYKENTIRGDVIQDWKFRFNRQDLTNLPDMVSNHIKLIEKRVETPEEARLKISETDDFEYLKSPVKGEFFINRNMSISSQIIQEDLEENENYTEGDTEINDIDTSVDIQNINESEDI